MSRLNFFKSAGCCDGSEHEQRVDHAAAYLLGLVLYFNQGEKETKIFQMVTRSGFTQAEVQEAQMMLISADIIEPSVSTSCFRRNQALSVNPSIRETSLNGLFRKLEPIHRAQRQRDEAGELASEAIINTAKTFASTI